MKRTNIRNSLISLTVALILTLIAGCQPQAKPTVEPASRTEKVVFPLSQAIKQPISNYTLDELAEMWLAFKRAPIKTGGFNHFTLPFHYVSRDGTGDRNEAYAFSFLLSHSIDWAPGCYCSRHAYFTFKRARRYVRKLAINYDKGRIKFAIEDWQATHAVGGKLIQSKDGYAGTLVIFNRTGKQVLKKKYEKPREFFDLLGDMTVDAIAFFGGKPTRALVQHLHRRRCKHHQSIIDLGEAAFVKEKSKEEFDIYKKILKRDPDFADVRYWWANQKWWQDRDRAQYEHQMATAMNSYLVEAAVWDFTVKHPPDEEYTESHKRWLKDAEMLVGPNFPNLLLIRLKSAFRIRKVSDDLIIRATRAATKYPNVHGLVWYVGEVNRFDWGAGDPDLAASMHLVGMQDRFLPSGSEKEASAEGFALAMMELGHHDIAAQVLLPIFQKRYRDGGPSKVAWCAEQIAESLERMGRYEEAVKYYRVAFKGLKEGNPAKNKNLVEGGIAAALAGRSGILEQILRERRKELAEANMLFLLEAYHDVLTGKPVDIKTVKKKAKRRTPWSHRQEVLFYAQVDLLSRKSTWREGLTAWLKVRPSDRSFWILFDAYDRKDPRPESACFYEAVEWLHGNDPWVKKAVADYRQRAKKTRLLSADDLLKRLKDFTPVPWPKPDSSRKKAARKVQYRLPPGAVATAVRRLVAKGEFNKAEKLALRFHHLAVDSDYRHKLRAHASHLFHLVRQAREKANRLKAKTNRPGL